MTNKASDQSTLKKLMKIIYDKEKQIDKYKKMLKQKQGAKQAIAGPPQIGLSCEQKDFIARQIYENKKFLQTASIKLLQMENRIQELQTDLQDEENRNYILEEQMYVIKNQCKEKEKIINELKTLKQLLENNKILKNGELSEKEMQIQCLIVENQKIKIIEEQTKAENTELRLKFRSLEIEINKALKYIYKNFRPSRASNKSHIDIYINLSRISKRSEKQIKTYTFLQEKLEHSIEQKVRQVMGGLKSWEESLVKREQEWKKNFERALSEHSIDGISHLVEQSIILKKEDLEDRKPEGNNQSNFYQTSMYKKNEEQLLKELEQQCQKSLARSLEAQKQKLVELSQIKQSLKMTKQVNEQLFTELNRQQNLIRIFKQTFRSMQQKKLFKNQDTEQLKRLRSVLASRN